MKMWKIKCLAMYKCAAPSLREKEKEDEAFAKSEKSPF